MKSKFYKTNQLIDYGWPQFCTLDVIESENQNFHMQEGGREGRCERGGMLNHLTLSSYSLPILLIFGGIATMILHDRYYWTHKDLCLSLSPQFATKQQTSKQPTPSHLGNNFKGKGNLPM